MFSLCCKRKQSPEFSLSLFLASLYPLLPPFLHKHTTHRGRNFMCFSTSTACFVTARKSIVSSSLVLAERCHNVRNKTWQKKLKAQKKKKKSFCTELCKLMISMLTSFWMRKLRFEDYSSLSHSGIVSHQ